jgi:hypothetical protein
MIQLELNSRGATLRLTFAGQKGSLKIATIYMFDGQMTQMSHYLGHTETLDILVKI